MNAVSIPDLTEKLFNEHYSAVSNVKQVLAQTVVGKMYKKSNVPIWEVNQLTATHALTAGTPISYFAGKQTNAYLRNYDVNNKCPGGEVWLLMGMVVDFIFPVSAHQSATGVVDIFNALQPANIIVELKVRNNLTLFKERVEAIPTEQRMAGFGWVTTTGPSASAEAEVNTLYPAPQSNRLFNPEILLPNEDFTVTVTPYSAPTFVADWSLKVKLLLARWINA